MGRSGERSIRRESAEPGPVDAKPAYERLYGGGTGVFKLHWFVPRARVGTPTPRKAFRTVLSAEIDPTLIAKVILAVAMGASTASLDEDEVRSRRS